MGGGSNPLIKHFVADFVYSQGFFWQQNIARIAISKVTSLGSLCSLWCCEDSDYLIVGSEQGTKGQGHLFTCSGKLKWTEQGLLRIKLSDTFKGLNMRLSILSISVSDWF